MKKAKKILILCSAILTSLTAFPGNAFASGWHAEGNSWRWYLDDEFYSIGWKRDNGTWYYFDQDTGYMRTGWVKDSDRWYYLAPDGHMETGLNTIDGKQYFFTENGAMVTGWQTIGPKQYYFAESGEMVKNLWIQSVSDTYYYLQNDGSLLTNDYTPDGYYVDNNGRWIKDAPSEENRITEEDLANEVFELVNKERSKRGLAELERDSDLDEIALLRAEEICENFSHYRPDGSKYDTAYNEYGYDYIASAENIASGYADAKDVMKGWMHSPGHKANILNSDITTIGIGVQKIDGRYYWVQDFSM